MMPARQNFANNAFTELTAAATAAATTLSVASSAAFPSTGQFTVVVGGEVVLVTGVAGTTWTVARAQEGTAAVALAAGLVVVATLTAGGIESISRQSLNGVNVSSRRELNFVGGSVSVADNPAAGTCDITVGGGGITPLIPVVAPPTTGWTLADGTSGQASVSAPKAGVLQLANAGSGSGSPIFYSRAVPLATPWAITAALNISTKPPDGHVGIAVGDASGKVSSWSVYVNAPNSMFNIRLTTGGQNVSVNDSQGNVDWEFIRFLQIRCDGTNIYFNSSSDGLSFVTWFQESVTAYFSGTPTLAGLFMLSNSNPLVVNCPHLTLG